MPFFYYFPGTVIRIIRRARPVMCLVMLNASCYCVLLMHLVAVLGQYDWLPNIVRVVGEMQEKARRAHAHIHNKRYNNGL